MIYNVVLVSDVQQRDSAIYIHVNVYIYLLSHQVVYIYIYSLIFWASLKAQMVKNLPTMQET